MTAGATTSTTGLVTGLGLIEVTLVIGSFTTVSEIPFVSTGSFSENDTVGSLTATKITDYFGYLTGSLTFSFIFS